jgi:hypothetical protein
MKSPFGQARDAKRPWELGAKIVRLIRFLDTNLEIRELRRK